MTVPIRPHPTTPAHTSSSGFTGERATTPSHPARTYWSATMNFLWRARAKPTAWLATSVAP